MSSKRKRTEAVNGVAREEPVATKKAKKTEPFTIQIVAGSYDRVLHGMTATILPDDEVEFADTFLFNAHASSIRCLAISPPSAPEPGKGQKVMLATGSTDERINVYQVSAHPPSRQKEEEEKAAALSLSAVAPRRILENRRNRELGTLLHHASTVTRLAFPTRGKLVSASEDSTLGVTRTRDMALLSSIRVPVPKPMGRPSGDTAALGATPAGVNDFAVHPSMKLMISVSRGERCMRLWNLMTGKKAGVLNFGREALSAVGEGRVASSGEGRRVVWAPEGVEEFAVAFDRDVLVFGMDGTPRCHVLPDTRRKIHELAYFATADKDAPLLAVATEDGHVLFFSTKAGDLTEGTTTTTTKTTTKSNGKHADKQKAPQLPVAKFVAQLGGKEAGVQGRIKDFALLTRSDEGDDALYLACGSSDGKIRLFKTSLGELEKAGAAKKDAKPQQVGKLLGTYDTQNRITCLEAFIMIPRPEGVEDSEDEFEDSSDEDDDEEDDDEN